MAERYLDTSGVDDVREILLKLVRFVGDATALRLGFGSRVYPGLKQPWAVERFAVFSNVAGFIVAFLNH